MDESGAPKTVEELIRNLGTAMADGFQVLGVRIGRLEPRLDELEAWRKNNSDRVRGLAQKTSDADMGHDAKLAVEIVARHALEMKVDAINDKQNTQLALLSDIARFSKNPIVKQIFTAIGTALLSYLAMKGIK